MIISPRFFLISITCFSFLITNIVLAEEWNVGLRVIQVSDPAFRSDIEVAVWYPTQSKAKEESMGAMPLLVAKDAESLSSSQGLIILSHGFSGNFMGHNDTAQFLAKRGYIVATPTHPDLPGLATGQAEFDPLVARPRHIQLIISELLNQPSFTSIDQSRIGIIGFSLGAYTALSALGATPDLSGLKAYCEINQKDTLLCSYRAKQRFPIIAASLTPQKNHLISAAILLAPAYGPLFSEETLAGVKTPIGLFSAEKDQELDNQYNAEYFKKFLPNITSHKALKDAGHFIFMAPCPEGLKQAVPLICEDPVSVDREAIHHELNRDIDFFFSTAFNHN